MNPHVTIIILNWNGWKDTIECLESIYQIYYPHFEVVLVDNHSENNSIQKIREYCQGELVVESKFFNYTSKNKPITLIEYSNDENRDSENNLYKKYNSDMSQKLILIKNDENYGFAEGNNIGIRFAFNNLNSSYILLLNNDTIVDPKFLNEMIKASKIYDKTGIIGAKLLNAYNTKIIDSTGHVISWGRIVDRGHGEVDHGQYDKQEKIMGAMAAAALYNKEMLLEIGLLDTSYVTLGEDADLSWRAYNKDWKAIYAPTSIIYHKRGRSITKKSVLPKMTILSTKNTVEYVTRYGNSIQKLLFILILFKEGLFVLVGSLIRKNDVNISEYFNMLLKSYLKIFKSMFYTLKI
ncbi:MAG: glycosyltransferase family 2 protein [Methanobacterium sp.]